MYEQHPENQRIGLRPGRCEHRSISDQISSGFLASNLPPYYYGDTAAFLFQGMTMQRGRGGMGSRKHAKSGHATKSPRFRFAERLKPNDKV
jgi:hypothetical protein